MKCEICKFNNPKGTVTAVIIQDGKILILKRNENPFKGHWDLPGGYMNAGETPEQALKREIKEELNFIPQYTKIGEFAGTAHWRNKKFPIISHVFLVEPHNFQLNNENSDFNFIYPNHIRNLAFDSNNSILNFISKNLIFDIGQIKKLVSQLDSTAQIDEQSLYKAVLNGFVSKKYRGGVLIGMGWIFIRQTILRKQAVIEDLVVSESQRGKGLGTLIMQELIQWAEKNNCDTIELTTNPKRKAANELYKKLGFTLHPTNHYLYKL